MKMNKLALLLVMGVAVSSGCARRYKITLNYGQPIITASKPRLEHGYYRYKDAGGREGVVAEGRVREIEPASMARDENPSLKRVPVK